MAEWTATRRGVLLAAGSVAAAGCSNPTASPQETISASGLPETDPEDSDGIVVDNVPVDIEAARLRATADRVTELLATLPLPLGRAEVPNGYIRQRLVDAAAEAADRLEEARAAQTDLAALNSLRRARAQARYAAEGWAFVEEGRTVSTLRDERRAATADAQDLWTDLRYRAADPVRAAVVYDRIETYLQRARMDEHDPALTADSSDLLAVAKWGQEAESTGAYVDDGGYLYERFEASLGDDAGDVRDNLVGAADTLGTELRERQAALPPEPTTGDRDVGWQVRYRLRRDAESSADAVGETAGPASGVRNGVSGLADFLALEDVRTRLDDGEQFGATDAGDIRAARSAAVTALETALEESPRPALVRPILAESATVVGFADEQLAEIRRDVRPGRVDDILRRYHIAAARGRNVPEASRLAVDALES